MPSNVGYNPNRNVRTSSNGRRAGHGYNYRLLIQEVARMNREQLEDPRNKRKIEMFDSVIEAFDTARKLKGRQ